MPGSQARESQAGQPPWSKPLFYMNESLKHLASFKGLAFLFWDGEGWGGEATVLKPGWRSKDAALRYIGEPWVAPTHWNGEGRLKEVRIFCFVFRFAFGFIFPHVMMIKFLFRDLFLNVAKLNGGLAWVNGWYLNEKFFRVGQVWSFCSRVHWLVSGPWIPKIVAKILQVCIFHTCVHFS